MKTLRLIGIALFAVLMCVNFASCSGSDDDPTNEDKPTNENISTQKLISSLTTSDGNTFKFTYNDKNQLTSVNEVGKNNKIDFKWSDSQIVATPTNKYENTPVVYQLNNGIITSVEGRIVTYDKDKHLTSTGNNNWTWSNENISKLVHKNDRETQTHTYTYYTDKENKHPIVDASAARLYYVGQLEYDELLFIAHPFLLGKTNKNLIKTHTEGSSVMEYIYELDNNGYPVKIKENGETAYFITWI